MKTLIGWICEKRGHKTKASQKVYATPSQGCRAVADRVVIERSRCMCGKSDGEHEIERKGIQGLTMPSGDWDVFYAYGRVEI